MWTFLTDTSRIRNKACKYYKMCTTIKATYFFAVELLKLKKKLKNTAPRIFCAYSSPYLAYATWQNGCSHNPKVKIVHFFILCDVLVFF